MDSGAVVQCPACFKRVRRLKNGTIAKHFGLETRLLSWEQKVAFRIDGRVRVHNADGNECPASVANR